MELDIYQIDAFTDKVFGGNPHVLFLSKNGYLRILY